MGLYISRRIGENRFGVVDTDDYTETEVTRAKLVEIVNMGLTIDGVETIEKYGKGRYSIGITSISVVQNPAYNSVKQVKSKVFLGVDITLSGDCITGISWDDSITKEYQPVRLSDFGTSCADVIFGSLYGFAHHNKTVIIVLDDKIKIRKNTFKFAFSRNSVQFDLREVTNNKVAAYVYRSWIDTGPRLFAEDDIVDNPDRYNLWVGIRSVECRAKIKGIEPTKETIEKLEAHYLKEFEKLANSRFQFIGGMDAVMEAKDYIRRIRQKRHMWDGDSVRFDDVFYVSDNTIFTALDRTTICNKVALYHFDSYMENVPVSDAVKEVYVKLVKRANQWFMQLYHDKGWHI